MAREKFPERVPFRLTRMLINAMEVKFPKQIVANANRI
jgi:phosphatidylinositol kinase/protein kinase (PI-3  family)